jgi:hypothetical protein
MIYQDQSANEIGFPGPVTKSHRKLDNGYNKSEGQKKDLITWFTCQGKSPHNQNNDNDYWKHYPGSHFNPDSGHKFPSKGIGFHLWVINSNDCG